MKKSILLFVLSIFILFNGVALADGLTTEYEALQKQLKEEMKAVNSRDAYNAFIKGKKEKLEALVKKVETATPGDDITLLHGNLLYDLDKVEPALEKFETLIKAKSSLTDKAIFGKVRILQKKKDFAAALKLFKGIEGKIKKDEALYEVLFMFGYSAPDVNDKIAYSNKFLAAVPDDSEAGRYKSYIYENLAGIEKERGNKAKALEILEKALASTKDPRTKKSLESSIKQMKMVDAPAIDFSAELWVNSKALNLAALKGKVVVIDFWAPWCPPVVK